MAPRNGGKQKKHNKRNWSQRVLGSLNVAGHSQKRGSIMLFLSFFWVGLLFVGIGDFFWWSDKTLKQECTAQTAGVVIDEGHYEESEDGRRESRYRPTFTYSVEGVEYTK